jgi:S1-C subfamily serine protease
MENHSVLKRWALISFIAMGLMAILAFTTTGCAILDPAGIQKAADTFARDNTVIIAGATGGQCSGVKVHVRKTNKLYILSAAHCYPSIAEGGFMSDESEVDKDKTHKIVIVAVDPTKDLMLLESPYTTGVFMAERVLELHEPIHTMGWGGGRRPYRTDGEVVALMQPTASAYGDVLRNSTTALVIPGTSGGAVLNERNELVGIISGCSGEFPIFSFIVPLQDIKAFLGDK